MAQRRNQDLLRFVLIVGILVLLNVIGSFEFIRLDLTSEKRYTLNDNTVELLENVDERIYAKVYLEGENLPSGFQKLQRETQSMLREMRAYNSLLEFEFIDPAGSDDDQVNEEVAQQLAFKGLRPTRVQVEEKTGNSNLTIFAGAILSLGDEEIAVPLLTEQIATAPQAQINASIQNLEYNLANAIRRLTSTRKPSIAFLQGHGEIDLRYVADFARTLSENYQVDRFDLRNFKADSTQEELNITQQLIRLNRFDALIVAKPTKAFTDLDKFLLDQYVMAGGKIIWCIDAVAAEIDSLSKASQFLAFPRLDQLGIEDMLFKYGVRINTNLVQDLVAAGLNDQKQIKPWVYWPLVMPQVNHPIAKDINAVKLEFASTLDTIIAPGIRKTVLLRSSPYSKTSQTPHMVSLRSYYTEPDEASFDQSGLPLAILLEGEFESVFKNRIKPKEDTGEQLRVLEKSANTQMLVVGDGDILKNQLNIVDRNIERGFPLPLGYDQFTGQQYGNADFMLNAVDYLLDDSGLISIRSRELKIRLLDFNKIKDARSKWQIINTGLPLLLLVLFGVIYNIIRKRKYTA